MKKLFAILAVVVLFSAATFASTYSPASRAGDFTATFYCLPDLGTNNPNNVPLGNYFADNVWTPVNAAFTPAVMTFTVHGNNAMGFVFTGSVLSNTAGADVKVDWAVNAATWGGSTAIQSGASTTGSPSTNPTNSGNGVGDCDGTITVTATATDVVSSVTGAVSYTATLTAVVTL